MRKQALLHLNGLLDEIMYEIGKDREPGTAEHDAFQRLLAFERLQYREGNWVSEVMVYEEKERHRDSVRGKAELITSYLEADPELFDPCAYEVEQIPALPVIELD